ncbi:hypothetical protein OAQ99_05535 [Candidatus Kapabacteria bacterium]|nr:hypothetical protein [Candidatus Kapabacteria bacterium]
MDSPTRIHTNSNPKHKFRGKLFAKLAQYPNLLIIYKAVAMIMVWVGVWGLIDLYIFPNSPTIRYVLVISLGIFFLYIDDGSIDELANVNPSKYSENIFEDQIENENQESK